MKNFTESDKGKNNNATITNPVKSIPTKNVVQTRLKSKALNEQCKQKADTGVIKLDNLANRKIANQDKQNQFPTPCFKLLVDAATQPGDDFDYSKYHDGIEVEVHAPDDEFEQDSELEDLDLDSVNEEGSENVSVQEVEETEEVAIPTNRMLSEDCHKQHDHAVINTATETGNNNSVFKILQVDQAASQTQPTQQGIVVPGMPQNPMDFQKMLKDMLQSSMNKMMKEYGKGNLAMGVSHGQDVPNTSTNLESNENTNIGIVSHGNVLQQIQKLPSDTTLYTPALKQKVVGDNVVNRISDFVESI